MISKVECSLTNPFINSAILGVLKFFRVQLPRKFRSDEQGRLLIQSAVNIKVKKLKKYEKEYQLWKEAQKQAEDPLVQLEKKNKRLFATAMKYKQVNSDCFCFLTFLR